MMGWLADQFGFSADTQAKLIASIAVIGILAISRWLVLRAVQRRFEETWVAYRARKVATITATIVGLAIFAWIWIDAFNDVATFLGLLSAGIAIALADVLKNIAGWVYVLSRRPFRVGDRIEIGSTKGDVVDIRLFRFSLMEVGNWVQAEQSTGRLVHVPNGLLFNEQVANYTEGFAYIWSEIPVLVTFESDRRLARRMIEHAVRDNVPDVEHKAGSRIRETARNYHIKIGALTPIVYLTVQDSGVLLTARFLCDARNQRGITERIWEAILDGLDREPAVELAYPTVRTFLHDPVRIASDKTSS
ncbi:MAG TPA: mechanosensitive ion channel domain-containing protein [Acidimicrobiia bacterium]|jgi:small-conductance mechanosensitive channel|nr:mechanosensitive ion channel domain-containing protein [Acidimicrobiia bacterium]